MLIPSLSTIPVVTPCSAKVLLLWSLFPLHRAGQGLHQVLPGSDEQRGGQEGVSEENNQASFQLGGPASEGDPGL